MATYSFLLDNNFMKLKQSVVMVLVLLGLLSSVCLGIYFSNGEENDEPEIVENVIPERFERNIENKDNVDSDIVELIETYINRYFKSMYTLELNSTIDLFNDELKGYLSDSTIKFLIDNRKKYDFDFSLSDAYYDLKLVDYKKEDGKYYLTVLEDDYMNFAFLNGITSEILGIENYFIIEKVNGEYKINNLEKIQGYYSMFYDNEFDSTQDIDKLYEYYADTLNRTIENENYLKGLASEKPYVETKTYEYKYNRELAVNYADKYYTKRNTNWYDFSDEGGNCQNYASQALYEGGIIMDYSGSNQWKCYISDPEYDPEISEDDEQYGRSRSWVNVNYFYDYADNNKGMGLVSDCDANIYYAEPGDIIQVGMSSYSHTTIVSKIVDGHILLNSNSIDMKDYPLVAYTYPKRRLIKILGANS